MIEEQLDVQLKLVLLFLSSSPFVSVDFASPFAAYRSSSSSSSPSAPYSHPSTNMVDSDHNKKSSDSLHTLYK